VADNWAARWGEIAPRVLAGQTEIRCPIRNDDVLDVTWIPFDGTVGGQFWLRCPSCQAENYILKRLRTVPPHR
jgi:hypothetical protein